MWRQTLCGRVSLFFFTNCKPISTFPSSVYLKHLTPSSRHPHLHSLTRTSDNWSMYWWLICFFFSWWIPRQPFCVLCFMSLCTDRKSRLELKLWHFFYLPTMLNFSFSVFYYASLPLMFTRMSLYCLGFSFVLYHSIAIVLDFPTDAVSTKKKKINIWSKINNYLYCCVSYFQWQRCADRAGRGTTIWKLVVSAVK